MTMKHLSFSTTTDTTTDTDISTDINTDINTDTIIPILPPTIVIVGVNVRHRWWRKDHHQKQFHANGNKRVQ